MRRNELEEQLKSEVPDKQKVIVSFQMLEEKMTELDTCTTQLCDLMLEDTKVTDEAIQEEISGNDEYKIKYFRARLQVENLTKIVASNSNVQSNASAKKKHTFKLPRIELPKFNGNVKDWLNF